MDELLDIFDQNGNHLGSKPRSFCHSINPGVYHKSVLIWFKNSLGEILVTKRNINKKQYPGKWEMAAAGHVDANENPIDTCVREIKEELSLDVKKEDIKYLTEWKIEEEWELAQIYLVNIDVSVDDIKVEKEEIDDVKWLNYDDFKRLLFSNDFCEYENKEYKKYIANILKGE